MKTKYFIFSLFLFVLAFAATADEKEIFAGMQFAADEKQIFTGKDVSFTLNIPDLEPSKIQVAAMLNLPEGVHFCAGTKTPLSGENRGTKLKYWFSFSKEGFFQLPPLELRVKRHSYSIPFAAVRVYPEPESTSPQMIVELRELNTGRLLNLDSQVVVEEGTKIQIKISVLYALQLIDFSWVLPENAIFVETARYELAGPENRKERFNPNAERVASFMWQPLTEGTHILPEIRMIATGYNGSRPQLLSPEKSIQVIPKTKNLEKAESENLFAYAFSGDSSINPEKKYPKLSESELESIAIEYKKNNGIIKNALSAIGIGGKYAFFAGGPLKPVPEADSKSSVQLAGGTRVKLVRRAGSWQYVQSGSLSGWVAYKDLYFF